MRKAVEDMNKNLESMKNRANGASKGVDKVNKSFVGAAKGLMKFALAYFAVSKLINGAFAKANESIQIQLLADTAGVATEKIGKLGKALRAYGGDARSAGRAYASLTNVIGGAQHGMGINQDIQRVNAMYGIAFNYGNITQDQLMTNIATTMQRLKRQGNQWGINQIASAYGFDESMASFLAEQGANWSSKANRQIYKQLSKTDTQKLVDSQDRMKEVLNDLSVKLIPLLTTLVDGVGKIVDWLYKKETPKTRTNEAGEAVYDVPMRRYGLFGPKTSNLEILQNRDGLAYTPSAFDMGYKKWESIKAQRDKEMLEAKQKYESIPGQKYSRNWFTGEQKLSIDLDLSVEDKTNNGVRIKGMANNGYKAPATNVIGG